MNLTSGKRATLDATCADAVDAARAALTDVAPEGVGEHLGVEPESERVVLHYFASQLPGYRGWRWAVSVMRASRSKTVTIGDTVLLPGPDALLPPTWVPWTERLRPGDLGVGDLLPTDEDDPRLEPGWNAVDDLEDPRISDLGIGEVDQTDADSTNEVDAEESVIDLDPVLDLDIDLESAPELARGASFQVALELDLLRPRVLSPIGLDDAVDRWVAGEHGPAAPMAQSAPATCASCGFRLAVRGRLGQAFGICANEISASDGHIVTMDHGCGAHSEAVVVPTLAERATPYVDEVGFEIVDRQGGLEGEPEGESEADAEPVNEGSR